MTRTQRVWMIVQMLEQGAIEIEDLARLFDVTPRTIRRDLVLIETDPINKNIRRRVLYVIEPVC